MKTSTLRQATLAAVLGLSVFTMAAPAAQAATFDQVKADASRVAFTYRQMGVAMEGKFNKFDARLNFDPAKPEAGQATVDIDVASVDAGSDEATAEVTGKTWFDAAKHPKASFKSSSVKALGGNRYEALGTLTIKGRSQNVTAPFTFDPASGAFDGSFVIKRGDFAIGEGEWADFGIVANEIQVKFHLQAAHK